MANRKYMIKKKLREEIIRLIISILCLVFVISLLGFKVLSGSFKKDKVNVLTAGYLSFNYKESDDNVIKLVSAMPIGDDVGKKSNKKTDYFEFKITNKAKKRVKYEILLEPLSNNFDGDFLKIYLTDDKDIALRGFTESVPVWSKFNNTNLLGSAIIYYGYLNGKESRTFRLRTWISEDYVVSDKASSFSFRINIRDIDEEG